MLKMRDNFILKFGLDIADILKLCHKWMLKSNELSKLC